MDLNITHFDSEDEDGMFLRNVGIHVQGPYPRIQTKCRENLKNSFVQSIYNVEGFWKADTGDSKTNTYHTKRDTR
jgi:hypothetical protein